MLLAMGITVVVAGAVAGMIGAISAGVGSRRDTREIMVRASTAQARLASFVASIRCVLYRDQSSVALWTRDSRESGTIHLSEVRWLMFDPAGGTISSEVVSFPPELDHMERDVLDTEHPPDSDWLAIRQAAQDDGWLRSTTLVDGLESVTVSTDVAAPLESRQVTWALVLHTDMGPTTVSISAPVLLHQPP
jgi:hypothetical protein